MVTATPQRASVSAGQSAASPPASSAPATVLLVEDDPDVANALRAALECYAVRHADSAAAAREAVEVDRPDLILLDLTLPDADGLVLLGDLKERARVPILVCSARPRDPNAVLSLRLGADDFIAKPFVVQELEARIATALRRAATEGSPAAINGTSRSHTTSGTSETNGSHTNGQVETPSPSGQIGDLVLNRARRRVEKDGAPLNLTPTEYRLFETLALSAGETVTREQLGETVWGTYDAAIGKAIDVHIARLRGKLASAGVTPWITAVRGFGFILAPKSG